MLEETLSQDELELLAYYRDSSVKYRKKILSYAKSLSLEDNSEFVTYMNERGYSKKQIHRTLFN